MGFIRYVLGRGIPKPLQSKKTWIDVFENDLPGNIFLARLQKELKKKDSKIELPGVSPGMQNLVE